jgi:hypothetical protein
MRASKVQNGVCRDTPLGLAPDAWITEALLRAPMLAALLLAQARPRAMR